MATADLRFRAEPTAPLLPDGLPRGGMSTVSSIGVDLAGQVDSETYGSSLHYRWERGCPLVVI